VWGENFLRFFWRLTKRIGSVVSIKMRAAISVVAILALIACASAASYHNGPCHKKMKWTPKVTSALPHETLDMAALPTNYDWRNVNGKNMVTITRFVIYLPFLAIRWVDATFFLFFVSFVDLSAKLFFLLFPTQSHSLVFIHLEISTFLNIAGS
jgi:hypothetical protein